MVCSGATVEAPRWATRSGRPSVPVLTMGPSPLPRAPSGAVTGVPPPADPDALAVRVVGALLFTLLHAFLYVDSRIFGLFKFHFNGLVLNVLFTPGGWESMELPAWDVATAIAGLAAVFGLELFGYTMLIRWAPRGPG